MHTMSGQRTGDDTVEIDKKLRARVHGMWTAVAPSWGEHASYVDERGADVTARMLELAALTPGERVLELACGPGGVGLEAASHVGPTGEVVLSDIAAGMTEIAEARAAARGLPNVSARVRDLEQIDEPDGSFDVVLCREGLMFAVDPARASREIARVLRPGGRVVIAVWGPRARNPWLGIVFDAASAQLDRPLPPPGVPNPFSLEDAGRLVEVLHAGALEDVVVSELPAPLRASSFEEWWRRTSGLAGPLTAVLESLPETALEGLVTRLRAAVSPYETPDGLELPGVTLIASARRAHTV
jgi:ubiquinone/menaquinone biosynthesis C-methylase UbiE